MEKSGSQDKKNNGNVSRFTRNNQTKSKRRLSCTCASLCVRVMLIQTGPRAIPDTGPDLVGRRTADFAADLALPSPAVSDHELVL